MRLPFHKVPNLDPDRLIWYSPWYLLPVLPWRGSWIIHKDSNAIIRWRTYRENNFSSVLPHIVPVNIYMLRDESCPLYFNSRWRLVLRWQMLYSEFRSIKSVSFYIYKISQCSSETSLRSIMTSFCSPRPNFIRTKPIFSVFGTKLQINWLFRGSWNINNYLLPSHSKSLFCIKIIWKQLSKENE